MKGGAGNDTLTGAGGHDTFIFATGSGMAALKERYAGRMDFGKASAAIKAQLSGPA